jgi:tetratricopeptide (TPR) repeat protein
MTTQEQPHQQLVEHHSMRMSFADFAEIHGKKIIVAAISIILLCAIYFTVSTVSNNAFEEESKRWAGLGFSQQSAVLQEFAQKNSGTSQALIARVEAARVLLAQGMTLFASTNLEIKKEATNNIEKAIELYDLVINDPLLIPELKAQSLLNAGKGHEALRRFDKAKDYYTQASLLGDKTGAGALAVKYLKNLQDSQVDLATFYKNFD